MIRMKKSLLFCLIPLIIGCTESPKVYNNIVDLTNSAMSNGIALRFGGNHYVYNNTIYGRNGSEEGFYNQSDSDSILINNIVQNTVYIRLHIILIDI